MSPHRRPARIAVFVLLLACAAAVAGWLVMALWNAVLVPALGARPLGYGQALGLLLLCRVLFGHWGPPRRGHRGPPVGPAAKWGSMSNEQRARFREHWQARCGKPGAEPPAQRPGHAASDGHGEA
ncbi:MAG: hypothetical protein HXX19_11545 [Rhodoferax sp.]|nr:hypothetical protein [Rhodoferax sp.]